MDSKELGIRMAKKTRFESEVLPLLSDDAMAGNKTYSIREVSRLAQVASYILRYWELKRLVSPSYTTRGHRRYQAQDIERILKIKDLIYVKGMRADGARKALADESRKKKASAELPLELAAQSAASAVLKDTKEILREMLQLLK